jgi:hypothetical protein
MEGETETQKQEVMRPRCPGMSEQFWKNHDCTMDPSVIDQHLVASPFILIHLLQLSAKA